MNITMHETHSDINDRVAREMLALEGYAIVPITLTEQMITEWLQSAASYQDIFKTWARLLEAAKK